MNTPKTPPRSKPNHPESGQQFKIILIDDDPAIHRLFRATFKDWTIDSALTKEEAAATMEANGHQVVVMDIRLRESAGYEVIDWVKKQWGRPVVVLSGYVDDEVYKGFMARGASAVLQKGAWKPFEIRQAVERAWEKFQHELDQKGIDTITNQLKEATKRLREGN